MKFSLSRDQTPEVNLYLKLSSIGATGPKCREDFDNSIYGYTYI